MVAVSPDVATSSIMQLIKVVGFYPNYTLNRK